MPLRKTTIVTLATAGTLVLTLANQIVLAYLFGAGIGMDAFLACGAVPFVVLNLAIGDLGYVLIPLLMQKCDGGQTHAAVKSTFSAIAALSGFIALAGLAGHRLILHLTTSASMPSATFELAVSLAPAMWLIIGLTILSSYLTGLHHFHRLFTVAAVTLALPYLGMILGGLTAAHRFGIHAVVWGWAAGTLLRTVLLYLTLPHPWPTLSLHLRDPVTPAMLRALCPLGLSLLPFVALPSIDVFWASRLPVGSISYLGYSTRIVIALASLVVQGLAVVLFPDLSEDARHGRLRKLGQKSRAALEVIFALIVPLAALAFLLRRPMLALLLQRGRFTASSSHGVAEVLPFYLLGTIPMAMMNIVSRSFFAIRDYLTPARTGALALALYVVLSGLLIHRFSYRGIGIAYAVFWIALFTVQTALLGKHLGPVLNAHLLASFLKVLLCAGTGIAAGLALQRLLNRPGNPHPALTCGIVLLAFVSVFLFLSTWLFGIPQYAQLTRKLLARVHPVSGARHPQASIEAQLTDEPPSVIY